MRRFVTVYDSISSSYRIAFRDDDDDFDQFYIDTDIPTLPSKDAAERLRDALNLAERTK